MGPEADVGVWAAGEGCGGVGLVAAEEGVHEGDVDPAEEVGVCGLVVDGFPGRGGVFPFDSGVHAVDAVCFCAEGAGGAEGGEGEPADGAGEAAEGVVFIA